MTLHREIAAIATDRVVQVRGAEAGDLARALAHHSADLAGVVMRTDEWAATPRGFVDAVLHDLEQVAAELLPAWLPDASDVSRIDLGGAAAIRMIAAARAARGHYARRFLVDLAVYAVTGRRDGGPALGAESHAGQLARLVADGFGRGRCVLLVPLPPVLTEPQRDAIVAGGDWLAHNAKMAVWLLGAVPLDAGRVPLATLRDAAEHPPLGAPPPATGTGTHRRTPAAEAAEAVAGHQRGDDRGTLHPAHAAGPSPHGSPPDRQHSIDHGCKLHPPEGVTADSVAAPHPVEPAAVDSAAGPYRADASTVDREAAPHAADAVTIGSAAGPYRAGTAAVDREAAPHAADAATVDSAAGDDAAAPRHADGAALPCLQGGGGKPHPASAVEKALEAALAAEPWAAGRRWNQTYHSTALASPVRLDLWWPAERCVVEVDGPEHCHPVHFEADRQRDVQLQLDGFAVLRFTNARIVHDVGTVVHQIGTYLRGRRNHTAKGP